MRLRKKIVNGQEYYYLEESMRLEKPRVFSVFLGKRVPDRKGLVKKKMELLDKIYAELLGGAERLFLAKEQLIEAEKRRRRYADRMKRLGRAGQDEKDEIDTVNFVYTTLSTEGVPITREDADLAYKFSQKNARSLRDENLRVALDMIKGLRCVKDSKRGMNAAFLLRLHGIIMAEYAGKNPGSFRKKQAHIYLRSYERTEEIGFRPPQPDRIAPGLAKLLEWYNGSVGRLNALELAALLHLRFYMIHPFEDGNKRMSRLLFNKALFDSGYPMLNISKDTGRYFDALIKSVEKKDERPFVEFAYGRFVSEIGQLPLPAFELGNYRI